MRGHELLQCAHTACVLLQFQEKTGYWAVTAMRWTFDKMTGYGPNMNEGKLPDRAEVTEPCAAC